VPYLLLGLQDVQWAVGNSRGARKLARTPHVNQKKKNIANIIKKKKKNEVMYRISSFTASEEDCPETYILVLRIH
jgi:hypothetical protein